MLTRKNSQAYGVLAALKQLAKEDEPLGIEPYLNGREDGFAVWFGYVAGKPMRQRKAVFSENRNSDDIVVYTGATTSFDMAGNVPTEETYRKAAKHFPWLDFRVAAEHILKFLRDEQLGSR